MRDLAQSAKRAASPEPARAVQRAPGRGNRAASRYAGVTQRRAPTADADQAVRETAAAGVKDAGESLPFGNVIQASFGRHDIGEVRAHTGPAAQAAAEAMGAEAYATGSEVAMAGTPDLFTTAHEAAHVVQQRAGVALPGGVGAAGDRHEAHADAVASAVVSGDSAEALLDEYQPGASSLDAMVQGFGGALAAPAPEEGGKGYQSDDASGDKSFTAQELLWIDEVLAHPLLQLVFESYAVPVAVLHRVKSLSGANGQTTPKQNDIAIADNVYADPEITADEHENGYGNADDQAVDEESFKGTLLHELFHFLVHNAEGLIDGMLMPRALVEYLVYPQDAGFAPYAFGWYPVPGLGPAHFQIEGVLPPLGVNTPWSVRGTPLEDIARDPSQWERSPMPESGSTEDSTVSPEEDLCESFSMFLTSLGSQNQLAAQYPLRFQLLDRYFGTLDALRSRTGAGAG